MILLKLSLLLGVEVFAPAKFVDIVEPETRDGVGRLGDTECTRKQRHRNM